MLAVSPFRSADDGEVPDGEAGGFLDDFATDGNLLDYFDFSVPLPAFDDGDILPDLEVDPSEILAELSAGEDLSATVEWDGSVSKDELKLDEEEQQQKREEEYASRSEEVVSTVTTAEDGAAVADKRRRPPMSAERRNRRKPSVPAGAGKKKAKVDWTADLHRRFVQAVEQLGIDKAVPSRILELMGIDCLTRHNIASHLQKYRSHRKHLLAMEAEAASWSQRRQMHGGSRAKWDAANPWLAPTIGFPPPAPPATVPHFQALHVWGHPTINQPLVPIWPRQLAPRAPMPPWAAQPLLPAPPDPSYWHHHYQAAVPHAMTQGTPCFPQPLPTVRFTVPPVPGIVPHPAMYRPIPPPASRSASTQVPLDVHPSKESIDAAIGDVLGKPWLPLPLGLKPPSMESVMVELQKQGISKVPPAACG